MMQRLLEQTSVYMHVFFNILQQYEELRYCSIVPEAATPPLTAEVCLKGNLQAKKGIQVSSHKHLSGKKFNNSSSSQNSFFPFSSAIYLLCLYIVIFRMLG